jgi:hypothetical protein
MKRYSVTRKFTAGILAGIEYTEITAVKFTVGYECRKPVGGSPYVITAVMEVA